MLELEILGLPPAKLVQKCIFWISRAKTLY